LVADDTSDEDRELVEVRRRIHKLHERRLYAELDGWLKAEYAELCEWESRLLRERSSYRSS
jgi:hypothetical protein